MKNTRLRVWPNATDNHEYVSSKDYVRKKYLWYGFLSSVDLGHLCWYWIGTPKGLWKLPPPVIFKIRIQYTIQKLLKNVKKYSKMNKNSIKTAFFSQKNTFFGRSTPHWLTQFRMPVRPARPVRPPGPTVDPGPDP